MMRTLLRLLSLSFLLFSMLCQAQEGGIDKSTYFEKAPQGMVRFFYDPYYYLVDKDCPFKHIERVAGFLPSKSVFHGEFKDFGPNGRVLLTGNYVEGKRQGIFKAYHPNGALKWEAHFRDGTYEGSWNYYYPDGKPLLSIRLDSVGYVVENMWNQSGTQIVTNGEGTYDFTMPIIGFTEHGYTFYNRKGKIKNGKPEGAWPILLGDHKKVNFPMASEFYDGGVRLRYDADFDFLRYYSTSIESLDDFSILPTDYFARAEILFSKNCTFDDFSGFTHYLTKRFATNIKIYSIRLEGDVDAIIQYKVKVSPKDEPKLLDIQYPETITAANKEVLAKVIKNVPYYLPSFKEGKEIVDTLTITFRVSNTSENLTFDSLRIKRETGE